jgi:hypothetical protein
MRGSSHPLSLFWTVLLPNKFGEEGQAGLREEWSWLHLAVAAWHHNEKIDNR